ncbi:MAG: DMT family transporter [Firmicutes bacterium]|nr:DMT family transporter [Bacillota bacterium]
MHVTGRLFALLIATGSGITMALQGSINSALGKVIGVLEATFIVHVVGLLLVSALLFVLGLGDGNLTFIFKSPWYYYLGGVLGVIIVYSVVRAIPPLGVAVATTAIILGQVFTAALVDHLGLFGLNKIPFTWYRVAGTVLMAGGAWLLLKK